MKYASRGEPALLTLAETLEAYAGKPMKAAFLTRAIHALTDLVDRLEPGELERAVAADTRASTLLVALAQPSSIGFLSSTNDPLAGARLRGIARRDELLASEGGLLTTEELAKSLRLTPQAVHKRRAHKRLLAFELGRRGLLFPAWQLTGDGVLPGLEEVLAAFVDDIPPLAIVRFFLSGNHRLGKRRPLDLLRKRHVAKVVAAARAFDEHGAA